MMNTECRYFVSRLSKGLFNQHFLFVVLLSSLQFNPPKNRLNTVFFKGKPTLRLVSDICTIKRSKRKSLRRVYTTEKLCPDQSKQSGTLPLTSVKKYRSFLQDHRRLYGTALSSQCKTRSSLCDNSFKKVIYFRVSGDVTTSLLRGVHWRTTCLHHWCECFIRRGEGDQGNLT